MKSRVLPTPGHENNPNSGGMWEKSNANLEYPEHRCSRGLIIVNLDVHKFAGWEM